MPFMSYENTPTNSTMIEGDYEVVLNKCARDYTKTQLECIICDFLVRTDVQQAYQGKHVFKRFYRDEAGKWPVEKIGKMANALGVENGNSFELADLVGLCCIIHVKPFTPPGGEPRDVILFYAPTAAGQLMSGGATANQGMQDVTDEVDDDLPF